MSADGFYKNKKNQLLTASSVVLLFVSTVCALVSFSPLWEGKEEILTKRSQRHAESLAYQLLQIHSQSPNINSEPKNSGGRGPASESEVALPNMNESRGQIGRDPWGEPYEYEVSRRQDGKVQKIEVWSSRDLQHFSLDVAN